MAKFVDHYAQNVCTQPPQPIKEPVAMKPRRFKMHPTTKLLVSKALGVKKCTVCFKRTTYQCSRTEAFTCSLECQDSRLGIEPAKPRLSGLVGRRYLLVGYSVPKLWVREQTDQEAFVRLMNKLAIEARGLPNVRSHVTVDEKVLAFYKNNWYRGTVTAEVKKKRLCRVFLPDLATEQVFVMRQLKVVPTTPLDDPCTVVQCTLDGWTGSDLSFEAEKILEKLCTEETPLVSYSPSLDEMVFKVNNVGGPNLADMLDHALAVTVTNDGPSHFLKNLPANEVTAQQDVPMIVTDLSDYELALSLAQGEYFQRCFRYETHFQPFADKSEGHYTPCDKELCLIRMKSLDGKLSRWLRAFGLLNVGDKCPRFELLDYGLVVKVNIADVRKMPKELLYPTATWTFGLQGECSREDRQSVRSPMIECNLCPSTDTFDANALAMGDLMTAGPYNLYPVVIPKIVPATEETPTDRVVCPDLLRQVYEMVVV